MNIATPSHSPRTLDIELLAIDLSTCSRCTGSLANVEQAITVLREVLASTGTTVRFRQVLVESVAQAQQLRLVSSPTIRINGRDLVLENLESRCGDCSEISGSTQGTDCRLWSYQGQTYTEAPVGMIVEAMLREIYRNEVPISDPAIPVEAPDNLQRFFHDKAEKAAPCGTASTAATGCGCR